MTGSRGQDQHRREVRDCSPSSGQPKIVADLDDYEIKLVRLEGDFVWHQHEDADEMFLVIDGRAADGFPGPAGRGWHRRDDRGAAGRGAQTVRGAPNAGSCCWSARACAEYRRRAGE